MITQLLLTLSTHLFSTQQRAPLTGSLQASTSDDEDMRCHFLLVFIVIVSETVLARQSSMVYDSNCHRTGKPQP